MIRVLLSACALACPPAHASTFAPVPGICTTTGGCTVPAGAALMVRPPRVLARSLRIARRWWGIAPLCGTPTLWSAPMPDTVAGAADDLLCRIYLPTGRDYRGTEPLTCGFVAHEYGHLLGLGHSSGIMRAPEPLISPTPCARAWPHSLAWRVKQARPIVWVPA